MPKVLKPRPRLAPASLLQLIWLASPALPVGSFSYSEGLEAAVEQGWVTDEASAGDWLLDQLELAQARCDLVVSVQALRAWQRRDLARLGTLDRWVRETRESAELQQQTAQMGRSLTDWLRGRGARDAADALSGLRPGPSWPVALGVAASLTGAQEHEALLAIAFGWAENMVQAAIKTVPLGQSAGQRILARLAAALPDAVDRACRCTDAERQAHSPMLAILSARHESQYSRLFRS